MFKKKKKKQNKVSAFLPLELDAHTQHQTEGRYMSIKLVVVTHTHTPALRKLRQEVQEFKTSLHYVRPCLKKAGERSIFNNLQEHM